MRDYPRTGHSVAEPGPGAGTRADRQRCAANAAVGCMAAQPEAVLLWAIRMPSGMGHYSAEAIAQRRELAELIRQSRATLAELGKLR